MSDPDPKDRRIMDSLVEALAKRERATPTTYYYPSSRPGKELDRALEDMKDSLGQFMRDLMRFGLELMIAKKRNRS